MKDEQLVYGESTGLRPNKVQLLEDVGIVNRATARRAGLRGPAGQGRKKERPLMAVPKGKR